jgi:hypothetical protein
MKTSPWIKHVKDFSKKHKMKYGDAMSDKRCKDTYKKIGGADPDTPQPMSNEEQVNNGIVDPNPNIQNEEEVVIPASQPEMPSAPPEMKMGGARRRKSKKGGKKSKKMMRRSVRKSRKSRK